LAAVQHGIPPISPFYLADDESHDRIAGVILVSGLSLCVVTPSKPWFLKNEMKNIMAWK
jgi:hypothetical protein